MQSNEWNTRLDLWSPKKTLIENFKGSGKRMTIDQFVNLGTYYKKSKENEQISVKNFTKFSTNICTKTKMCETLYENEN